jgi:peptidoglycan-associated lipoprotein
MHLRLFRLALVLAGAAALAACQGTVGTVDDTQPGSESSSDSASTSGTGDDSVSSTDTTVTDDSTEAGTATPGSTQEHPLDDPAGVLAARTIYFEFDSSEVPESERTTIEAHARYLSEHSGALITLEGHADERGSREYNIALGERRADAVRQLMTLLGATNPQIRAVSYGEERPATDGHDESAWQLNRRVEILYRVRE